MSNFSFLETEDGVMEIVQHNPERFSHAAEIIQNMLRGPSELSVIEAGWTEETAHDVISIAALATFYNLLVNGHGVFGSQEYFRKAAGFAGPNGGYTKANQLAASHSQTN